MGKATNYASDPPRMRGSSVVGSSGSNKSPGVCDNFNELNCDIDERDIYLQPKLDELYLNIGIEIEK